MERRVFEPDYSIIKKKAIAGIIAETVITIAFAVFSLWFYSMDIYAEHQSLDELLLLISGILIAHLTGSAAFCIISFRKTIKSVVITDDGLSVNDLEYRSIVDPDDMKGAGFNYTTGLLQILIPCAGQDLLVISSADSGKQIRRFFWTGPVSDKNAKKIRSDLSDFLNEGMNIINGKRFSIIKDTVKTHPVTVRINKSKFTKDIVKFSFIIGALVVILLTGVVLNLNSIASAVCLTAGAGFVSAYWISFVMKTKANIGSLVTELKLTDSSFSANGDTYDLNGLKVDLICIGNPDRNYQDSIRIEAPSNRFEAGLFIELSDSKKTNRYWIGPQIDSEAAAAIILTNYAESISEEMSDEA